MSRISVQSAPRGPRLNEWMPVLAIVAVPNGSGKTTLVNSGALHAVMPGCANSINADDVARAMASA